MLFLTADQHFGCVKMLERHRAQFGDLDEMDFAMMEAWNTTVSRNDSVIIAGDFSNYPAFKTVSILKRLNGRKHMVIGNADSFVRERMVQAEGVFKTIGDTINLKDEDTGRWFYATHYMMLSWRGRTEGTIHVHGHNHTGLQPEPAEYFSIRDSFDVGADGNGFAPIAAADLLDRSLNKDWDKVSTKFLTELSR